MERNGWNEFNRINVQSLFSWAVFSLAFLTAMIGILSFVHDGENLLVLSVYLIVYVVLLVGLLFCLHVTIEILRVVRTWRLKFKDEHKDIEDLYELLRFPRTENWVMKKWNKWLVISLIALLAMLVFVAKMNSG